MPYELLEDVESQENPLVSFGKEAGRHVARTASNLGTLAVGLPGDILSLVNDFIARPASEAISGEEGVPYEETLIGKALPTTATHRKNLQSEFGETIQPQNDVEKFFDDVLDIGATLSNPSRLARTGIRTGRDVLRPLAKSLGANFLGEAAKEFGGEEAGAATKIGSLFLLSLFDKESAARQVGNLYREAEAALPANATANAAPLTRNLNQLQTSITRNRPRGNLSTPERFVMDQTDRIRNLVQNGRINVQQAVAQKRSLNQELSGLFQTVPGRAEQQGVRRLATRLNGFLNETIEGYGRNNRAFLEPYRNADQGFGTLARSNFISHWVGQNIKLTPVTKGLLHLVAPTLGAVGGLATGGVGLAGPAIGAAIGLGAYQATKIGYRIANSPTLRRIYAQTMRAAAQENIGSFNRFLKELDEKLQEEESSDQYEFLED